jgi:hypothetical protein
MFTVAGLCVLALVWAAFVIAILAVCAAGGAADDQRERWHMERERAMQSKAQQERGAA